MFPNLDEEMARRKITRTALAEKIHKTPTTLSLKLNGKAPITLDECIEIKNIVNSKYTIDYLFSTKPRIEEKEEEKVASFIDETQEILKISQKRAGIDAQKVQRTVSCYLQIATDNQLNYNELLQVLSLTKDTVLQSLNKVAISALPDMTSDAAKL